MNSIAEAGNELLPELQTLRRTLHAIPELGLDLPETKKTVLEALSGLPLRIVPSTGADSFAAVLEGGAPGPTVLIRGDMDALPITEDSGESFASTNGRMHACGHDLHTAGMVGAARLLSARRDQIHGSVIFMFQAAEEGPGGAKLMVDQGILDLTGERPIAAYGVHVMSNMPAGTLYTRPGTVMAGSNDLRVEIIGHGGHGSMPATTVDPVPVIAELTLALQSYVTRRIDTFDPIVLSVTQLRGSTAINVIPSTASLGATVRTLSRETFEQLSAELPPLCEHIAAAYGAKAQCDFSLLYPVTVNDPTVTQEAIETLRAEFGADKVVEFPEPLMGSEDFSYVLNEVPGTFVFLGARMPEYTDDDSVPSNHSATVRFDDAVLGVEAATLSSLVLSKLGH